MKGISAAGSYLMPARIALTVLIALSIVACATGRRGPDLAREFSVESDVVYARPDGIDLHADVYVPVGAGPFPGVLVVHGGSWQRGSKSIMERVAMRLARGGYTTVAIDYRLAPAHRFPAPLDDCRDAVRWMRGNAARYRIDPRRVGAFGYSAGAHLVALLATDAAVEPDDGTTEISARIQAAVVGGTPADLRGYDNRAVRALLGGTRADLPELYARASPIVFVSPGDPPMFLYHGRHDWIVDVAQSRAMVDALRAAEVPVEYYESRLGHAAAFLFDGEEVARAIAFFDRWLSAARLAQASGAAN